RCRRFRHRGQGRAARARRGRPLPAARPRHRPLPSGRCDAAQLRLERPRAARRARARRDEVRAHRARALRGQGHARRPHPPLRTDGARAARRPRRCDRGSRVDGQYAARERSRRRRGHHAHQRAPHREPGRAQAEARHREAAARRDRRCRERARGAAGVSAALRLRRLDSRAAGFDAALEALVAFESAQDPAIDAAVADIVADVRARGDAALLEYTARFDRVRATSVAELAIAPKDMLAALRGLPEAQRDALQIAATRIRTYHERQKGGDWSMTEPDGTELGQRVTPLDRVGLYVPGGKAAYPSSVLMNALPASVAGVGDIVMVVPTPDGARNPLVLAAAHLAGVTRAYAIGGAQAIAALAYGTDTISAVDKICGPGNAYVAAAKRRVFGKVGIDMVAGASEIL